MVRSQRAALYDITVAQLSPNEMPFKRESNFKLTRQEASQPAEQVQPAPPCLVTRPALTRRPPVMALPAVT